MWCVADMTKNSKSKLLKAPKPRRKREPHLKGATLVAAVQASPYRDLDVESKRMRMPVRRIKI